MRTTPSRPPVLEHACTGDFVVWVESAEARRGNWTEAARAVLEDRGLVRERRLFFAVNRAMVCDRKKEAGGGAAGILVAEPDRRADAAMLLPVLPEGFGDHLCLCIHLDTLFKEPDHPPAEQGGPCRVCRLRDKKSTTGELLSELRR